MAAVNHPPESAATAATTSHSSRPRPVLTKDASSSRRHRRPAARTSAAALVAAVDEEHLIAEREARKVTGSKCSNSSKGTTLTSTWEKRAQRKKVAESNDAPHGKLPLAVPTLPPNGASSSSLGRLAVDSVGLCASLRRNWTDPEQSKPLVLPEIPSHLLALIDDPATATTHPSQQAPGESSDSGRTERSSLNNSSTSSSLFRPTTTTTVAARDAIPPAPSDTPHTTIATKSAEKTPKTPSRGPRSDRQSREEVRWQRQLTTTSSSSSSPPKKASSGKGTKDRDSTTRAKEGVESAKREGTRSASERRERTTGTMGDGGGRDPPHDHGSEHRRQKAHSVRQERTSRHPPESSRRPHKRDAQKSRDHHDQSRRPHRRETKDAMHHSGLSSGSTHHRDSRRHPEGTKDAMHHSGLSNGSSHYRDSHRHRHGNRTPRDVQDHHTGLSSSHHESGRHRRSGTSSGDRGRTSQSERRDRTTGRDERPERNRRRRSKSPSQRTGKRTTGHSPQRKSDPASRKDDIYAHVDRDMPVLGKIRDAVTHVRRAKSRSSRTGKRTTAASETAAAQQQQALEDSMSGLDLMQVDGVNKVNHRRRPESRSRRTKNRTVPLPEEDTIEAAKSPAEQHHHHGENEFPGSDLMKDDSVAVTKIRALRSKGTEDAKNEETTSHRRRSGDKNKHGSTEGSHSVKKSQSKSRRPTSTTTTSSRRKPPHTTTAMAGTEQKTQGSQRNDEVMMTSLSTVTTAGEEESLTFHERFGDSLVLAEESSWTEHNIESCHFDEEKEEEKVAAVAIDSSTEHRSNTAATALPKKHRNHAARTVQFGDVPKVTVHTYKDKQTMLTKWYTKDDLYQLLQFELRINLVQEGKKFSNHCCLRGLESYAEEQTISLDTSDNSNGHDEKKHHSKSKAMKLLSHAMFVLALQDYLTKAVANGEALKSKKDVEATPEEVMRRKCRNRTKEDRKTAYRLGLQDASDAKQIYAADAARDESHHKAMMYASEHQFSTRLGVALEVAETQLTAGVGFALGSSRNFDSYRHCDDSTEAHTRPGMSFGGGMGSSLRAERTTMSSFLGISKRRSEPKSKLSRLPEEDSSPRDLRASDSTKDASARNKKAHLSLMAKLSSRIKVPKGAHANPTA